MLLRRLMVCIPTTVSTKTCWLTALLLKRSLFVRAVGPKNIISIREINRNRYEHDDRQRRGIYKHGGDVDEAKDEVQC